MSGIIAKVRRLLRPPRVVAVTRRPAGWLAVGRRRLEDVVCWAKLEDGQLVGLVASRRGLRPARGWRFRGYLPGAPHSGRDVQLAPPAVSFPPVDLVAVIGDEPDPWTPKAMAAIGMRLHEAARDEWASAALVEAMTDPTEFVANHFRLIAEHGRPADLDDAERAFLASLAAAPDPERTSARPGPGEGARS